MTPTNPNAMIDCTTRRRETEEALALMATLQAGKISNLSSSGGK